MLIGRTKIFTNLHTKLNRKLNANSKSKSKTYSTFFRKSCSKRGEGGAYPLDYSMYTSVNVI